MHILPYAPSLQDLKIRGPQRPVKK